MDVIYFLLNLQFARINSAQRQEVNQYLLSLEPSQGSGVSCVLFPSRIIDLVIKFRCLLIGDRCFLCYEIYLNFAYFLYIFIFSQLISEEKINRCKLSTQDNQSLEHVYTSDDVETRTPPELTFPEVSLALRYAQSIISCLSSSQRSIQSNPTLQLSLVNKFSFISDINC